MYVNENFRVIMSSDDLNWSKHVEAILYKVNDVLGRTTPVVGNKNRPIYSLLCKSLH